MFTPRPLPQLQADTRNFLSSIQPAAELGDIGHILGVILEKKLECRKNKSTTSELYQCLSSMEHV